MVQFLYRQSVHSYRLTEPAVGNVFDNREKVPLIDKVIRVRIQWQEAKAIRKEIKMEIGKVAEALSAAR